MITKQKNITIFKQHNNEEGDLLIFRFCTSSITTVTIHNLN